MGTQQPMTHDVVHALLSRVVVDDVPEKRRSRRRVCFTGISVSATETYDADDHMVLVPAVTNDVSHSGLSFLCPRLLRVGTPLSIRFESLEHRPALQCVVRTVAHLGGEYHRVGVEFTE